MGLELTTATKQQIPQIKKLYRSAFPQNERKPFFIITKGQKQGKVEILSLEDSNFVGFCITIVYGNLVLLDYFAIHENSRGNGYGSEALIQLKKRYPNKKLFLEIEQPCVNAANRDERIRRKNFYLRNDFIETGLIVALFGVTMEVLAYDCSLTFEEYYKVYQSILSDALLRKNVNQITASEANYRIHPELRMIARNIPFDERLIKIAAPAQTLLLKIIRIPSGIHSRTVRIKGYQGMDVPVSIYEPQNAAGNLPCLLYIHGGGFGYKAGPHHKKLACIYAKEAHCRVIFPDYHLLPRYPYPAAYTDVLAVYRWLCNNTGALHIDKQRIAIAGDSAGAALTANLCNTAEINQLPAPCFQLMIYPATDATMQTESMRRYRDTPLWNSVNNRKMWDMYLSNAAPEERLLASPLQNELPQQIPASYIETAEFDCLHDEGILYARKLEAAGAKVEVYETAGTIHGYDAATKSNLVKASIEKRVAVLREAFI